MIVNLITLLPLLIATPLVAAWMPALPQPANRTYTLKYATRQSIKRREQIRANGPRRRAYTSAVPIASCADSGTNDAGVFSEYANTAPIAADTDAYANPAVAADSANSCASLCASDSFCSFAVYDPEASSFECTLYLLYTFRDNTIDPADTDKTVLIPGDCSSNSVNVGSQGCCNTYTSQAPVVYPTCGDSGSNVQGPFAEYSNTGVMDSAVQSNELTYYTTPAGVHACAEICATHSGCTFATYIPDNSGTCSIYGNLDFGNDLIDSTRTDQTILVPESCSTNSDAGGSTTCCDTFIFPDPATYGSCADSGTAVEGAFSEYSVTPDPDQVDNYARDIATATSPYECAQACAGRSDCTFSAFTPGYDAQYACRIYGYGHAFTYSDIQSYRPDPITVLVPGTCADNAANLGDSPCCNTFTTPAVTVYGICDAENTDTEGPYSRYANTAVVNSASSYIFEVDTLTDGGAHFCEEICRSISYCGFATFSDPSSSSGDCTLYAVSFEESYIDTTTSTTQVVLASGSCSDNSQAVGSTQTCCNSFTLVDPAAYTVCGDSGSNVDGVFSEYTYPLLNADSLSFFMLLTDTSTSPNDCAVQCAANADCTFAQYTTDSCTTYGGMHTLTYSDLMPGSAGSSSILVPGDCASNAGNLGDATCCNTYTSNEV